MPDPLQRRSVNPLVEGGEKILKGASDFLDLFEIERIRKFKDETLTDAVEHVSNIENISPRHRRGLTGLLTLGIEAVPSSGLDILDIVSAGAALPFTRFLKGSKLAGKMNDLAKFDDAEDIIKLVKQVHPKANDSDIYTAMSNSIISPDLDATGVSNQQMLQQIDNALMGGRGKIEEASFDTGKREVFESLETNSGGIRSDVENKTRVKSMEEILEEADTQVVNIKTDPQLDAALQKQNIDRTRIEELSAKDVRSNTENQELATARFAVSQSEVEIKAYQQTLATTIIEPNPVIDIEVNPVDATREAATGRVAKDPNVNRDLGGPQIEAHTQARINKEQLDAVRSTAAVNQIAEWTKVNARLESPQQKLMLRGLEKATREGRPVVLTKIADEKLTILSPSSKKPTSKEIRQVANRFSRLLPPGKKQAKPIAGEPLTRFTTKDVKDYLNTFTSSSAQRELANMKRLDILSKSESTELHKWVYKGGRSPTNRGTLNSTRMKELLSTLGERLRDRGKLTGRQRTKRDVGR